jgi:hypothetical protein
MRKDAHGGLPSPPTCNCLKYAEKKLVEEGTYIHVLYVKSVVLNMTRTLFSQVQCNLWKNLPQYK